MKQILVELDDRSARELERVAPARKRMRAEFVRLAIRRALDLALDRRTAEAYLENPLDNDRMSTADLSGWDERNALARTARPPRKARAGRRRTKSAAA